MQKSGHIRAYINPLPGYPEAAQRADILKEYGTVKEWYVESRNITRADFIQHLRAGDQAVVAHLGCLAKAGGRIDSRMADLFEARGDIHAKGCFVTDCANNASNQAWGEARKAAKAFLLAQRSVVNGSKRKISLTNAEIKTILRIQDSRRYKNDNQRKVAIEKEGIKPVPGRTWRLQMLPIIARERGIEL